MAKLNNNVPTLYTCKDKGDSFALSATNDPVLKRKDPVTGKMIEQFCGCGSTMAKGLPLQVVPFKSLDTVQVRCVPCNLPYKKISAARMVCPSCNAMGLVNGLTLWFKPTTKIQVLTA